MLKNHMKAIAIVNTVLLVGVILFLVFAKTESGESIRISKRDEDVAEEETKS